MAGRAGQLRINPSQLEFEVDPGKSYAPQVGTITIANPSNDTVTFKLKTNRPNRYYVRPIVGILSANASAEVEIHLLPLQGEVPVEPDKFLIASMVLTQVTTDPKWETIQLKNCTKHRVKCVFVEGSKRSEHTATGGSPPASSNEREPSSLSADQEREDQEKTPPPSDANESTPAPAEAPKRRSAVTFEDEKRVSEVKNDGAGTVMSTPAALIPSSSARVNVGVVQEELISDLRAKVGRLFEDRVIQKNSETRLEKEIVRRIEEMEGRIASIERGMKEKRASPQPPFILMGAFAAIAVLVSVVVSAKFGAN